MTPTQPTAEQLEVTQADRDLWKYLLDAPKSQCTMMDTCNPATAELQAIARHRQATEARCAEMLENKAQAMLNIDPDGAQEVAEALIMAARSIRSQSNEPING